MTPIEKNIRVVDEQGNEYEATYPKRAKGLVKNGRARFVDEHTICLACPPNQMEENTMTENENTVQTTVDMEKSLTAKDIFEKIADLQKQMANSTHYSVHELAEAISSLSVDDDTDQRTEQIELITSVYIQREFTLRQMLSFYEKMYNDLNMQEMQKVGIIKSAFSEQVESIIKSDLNKEDKYAAIGDVTHQITELTDKLLFPGTINKAKDRIVAEMAYIIKSPDTDAVAKAEAGDVLRSYMEWQTNDK